MGLDMYLTASVYVQDWAHNYPDNVIPADTKAKGIASVLGVDVPVESVSLSVGYWRKANAIHAWFVEKAQHGIDECQLAYVPLELCEELLALCEDVLKNPHKADELLPTQEGFFFGGTSYNERYMQGIADTVTIMRKAIALANGGADIHYQSSW